MIYCTKNEPVLRLYKYVFGSINNGLFVTFVCEGMHCQCLNCVIDLLAVSDSDRRYLGFDQLMPPPLHAIALTVIESHRHFEIAHLGDSEGSER